MKRPLNQLYDDFFTTSVPSMKQEKKEEKIILPTQPTYPTKEHHLPKYILGQEAAINKFDQALKRPGLLEKNFTTILVCGHKGTGKHILIQRFHEYLYSESFLSCKHPTIIDLSKIQDEMTLIQDIYSALQTPRQMIVFDKIDQCPLSLLSLIHDLCDDGILPLKNRYSSQKDKLILANAQLEKNLISSLKANQHYFIFLAHQSFSSLNKQLGNHFIQIIRDVIETSPLAKETLQQLIEKDVYLFMQHIHEQFNTTLTIDAMVNEKLVTFYTDEEGYHGVLNQLEKMKHALVSYLLNHPQPTHLLHYQNDTLMIDEEILIKKDSLQETLNEIQQEMDEIIGLDEIKTYIYSLRDFIQIANRRKQQGLKTEDISMHMIFTGNPGTGKTTMARLMAKYLKALGALKNGQLLEVTRADLVASYVGQTAPKTKQIIEASLGGVLFIDEAYSLYRGKEDSFGLEAIDMIVKCMEDYRDQLVVVLAGYTKEMATFLEANSGLKSRFANIIEFPDYTGEQLLEIALLQAKKKQYQISPEAKERLLTYFTAVQAKQDQRSGNGRLARNVVEDAILKQASRLVEDTEASLTLLIEDDFELDAL